MHRKCHLWRPGFGGETTTKLVKIGAKIEVMRQKREGRSSRNEHAFHRIESSTNNMPSPKILYWPTPAHFREWLEGNHSACEELWVGFYKKGSGKPSITWPEAVDEALCFGWIDGRRRSLGADAYGVRFTPRKTGSQWSAVNIKRVQRLSAEGRMKSAGLKAFEGATRQERKYSFEQRHESQFSADAKRQFRRNRKAWEYFEGQAPWYRRTATFWVVSAKKEDTRKRRLGILIADSAAGRPIRPLTRPVPKRQERMR